MADILTVDDESGIREFIADALTGAGHRVAQAGDAGEALARLEEQPFDLLICDLRMPGRMDGMDVVRQARARWPAMQVILLSAHGSVAGAVEAMRLGAFDFLEKPMSGPDELRSLVTRALNWRGAPPVPAAVPPAAAETGGGVPEETPRQRFLRELKRRHVYNVTATYAVVAFIILQLAELIVPTMTWLPAWAYTAIVILLIAGLPVAIVLGWIYDITSTGVKRTR